MADEVIVLGDSLSAARRPPSASQAVRVSTDQLLSQLEFPLLLSAFESVRSNLRDAYLGTAPFHDLHIQVQRAGYTLIRVAERATASFHTSRCTAAKCLEDLECVYALLLDGLDEVALAILRTANLDSDVLATDARELADQLDAAAADVHKTLKWTIQRRADLQKRRRDLAEQTLTYRASLTQARNTKAALLESYADTDTLYQNAASREAVARVTFTAVQAAQVVTAVGSVTSTRAGLHLAGLGGITALSPLFENELTRAREEKVGHILRKENLKLDHVGISREIAELKTRLRLASNEDELADSTIIALEGAITGLRELSNVMLKAEMFWSQVKTICGHTDARALQTSIESSMALSPTRRTKLWTSDGFKRRAVMVYCPWVALYDICEEYSRKMNDIRCMLDSLLENPQVSGEYHARQTWNQ